MVDPLRVLKVRASQWQATEPLGSSDNRWFSFQPPDSSQPALWLFKSVRAHERAVAGTMGQDCAEVIVAHLAQLLELPHVPYRLAEGEIGGQWIRGVACPTMVPERSHSELVLGNELLFKHYARQNVHYEKRGRAKSIRQYTLDAVMKVVDSLSPPLLPGPVARRMSALGVFTGYLLLDAWVANQDRHHGNWGAIRIGHTFHLAPTFDHGSALAQGMTDTERKARLDTRDPGYSLEAFTRKAKTPFRDATSGKHLGTVEALLEAARRQPSSARAWKSQLATVSMEQVAHFVERLPEERMSPVAKRFVCRLLQVNRQRLVECL